MDLELIKPELDESLVERMKDYLTVVDAGDLDTMEQFYADDFGTSVTTKMRMQPTFPRAYM